MSKSANRIVKELTHSEKPKKVMLYLSPETHKKLKEFCADKKIRMSCVTEKLIENFLAEVLKKGA